MVKHKIVYSWHKIGSLFRPIFINRKYKDRLFRHIFSQKKDLLLLYNAIADTNYENPDDLEIVTIEDIIYLHMKNDLSFIIADVLNMYEQQSSFNPNMPLRGFFYLAKQYEKFIASKHLDLHSSKQIHLPTPEFIVFYNGNEWDGERETFYLSDSFSKGHGSGCLECKCQMIHIGKGHNKELMDKCKPLHDYSFFVNRVSDNLANGMTSEAAFSEASAYCIEHDILKEILSTERNLVMHSILTEFNERQYKKNLLQEGFSDGFSDGFNDGFSDGYNKGAHSERLATYNRLIADGFPHIDALKYANLTEDQLTELQRRS